MELLRRYQFRLAKAKTASQQLAQLLKAVSPPVGKAPTFLIQDNIVGASGIARVLKVHPELAPYRRATWDQSIEREVVVLTNSAGNVADDGERAIPMDTLAAIVAGVPRRYPLHTIELLFEQDGIAGSGAFMRLPTLRGSALFNEARPHVSFSVGWTPSGYRIAIYATMRLGVVHTDDTRPPAPPELAAQLIKAFGKAREDLIFLRNPQEAALFEAKTTSLKAAFTRWKQLVHSEMSTLALPHELPRDGTGVQFAPMTRPHKPVLVSTFGPRGYRYISSESGSGRFCLFKRAPRGNRLRLDFDLGSTWRHYTGGLSVEGSDGHCYVPLPPFPNHNGNSYDIGSDSAWRDVVENVAVLVDHLEKTFVTEVEDVLGDCPKWYSG
jgi:hypothetical protein